MAGNPMKYLKLLDRFKIFKKQHPRVVQFVIDQGNAGLTAGTVIELKVTDPSGTAKVTNFRLTDEDIETIRMAKEISGK